MDKINIKELATADYQKPQIYQAFMRIENQVNRGANGYLFPVNGISFTDSPYTVNSNDSILIVDASSGAMIINLMPALEWEQKRLTIKKTDNSANTITVTANGSELIDGGATAVITVQYESIDLVSQNNGVWVI